MGIYQKKQVTKQEVEIEILMTKDFGVEKMVSKGNVQQCACGDGGSTVPQTK